MPGIITETDMTQGHCWPSTSIDPNSIRDTNVFINNKRIIGFGDKYLEAAHIGCTSPPTTHPVIANIIASPTVFVNNIPVLRDGDPLSCGDVANSQGASVFADGGGFGPVTGLPDFGPSATTGYTIGKMILEYPSSSIRVYGKYTRQRVGGTSTNPTYTYSFQDWCGELYIEPTWKIEIIEEGTGNVYYNTKDGTEGLPQLQPGVDELLRSPMPVKFRVDEGNLPSWANLDENTGIIQGNPSEQFGQSGESGILSIPFKVNGYISSTESESNIRTIPSVMLTLGISGIIVGGQNPGICPNIKY